MHNSATTQIDRHMPRLRPHQITPTQLRPRDTTHPAQDRHALMRQPDTHTSERTNDQPRTVPGAPPGRPPHIPVTHLRQSKPHRNRDRAATRYRPRHHRRYHPRYHPETVPDQPADTMDGRPQTRPPGGTRSPVDAPDQGRQILRGHGRAGRGGGGGQFRGGDTRNRCQWFRREQEHSGGGDNPGDETTRAAVPTTVDGSTGVTTAVRGHESPGLGPRHSRAPGADQTSGLPRDPGESTLRRPS
jgi:hypothetical protein